MRPLKGQGRLFTECMQRFTSVCFVNMCPDGISPCCEEYYINRFIVSVFHEDSSSVYLGDLRAWYMVHL